MKKIGLRVQIPSCITKISNDGFRKTGS